MNGQNALKTKKFQTEVHLSREMTLMDATLIGVGAMIGAGIFVLTGIAAGVAGPALILTFALNGIVALLTAMAYAELGSCFHDAGGGYLWVKEGLPKWNGFLSGWMSWFAHAVACSLYALGFGAYFGHVLHELGVAVPQWGFMSPQKTLAVFAAVVFAYINFRGASETGKVGNLVTITKIVILAIFVGFGLELMIHRGNWRGAFDPFMPCGWGGVFKAMGLTFIAFQGFEVIAQSSEEIDNPKKNIPRATFLSLIIVIPIYLLVAVTALGSVQPGGMTPWDYLAGHKEIALVEVSRQFFQGGGVLILIGGLISTMSALNATVYSSSRVAFAMGRDRNFPAFFSKVHPKNFTPQWSILVSLAIMIFMSITLPIEDVASAADIMFLLLFLQVNIAMIRLRKKRPDLDRGYSVPFFPVLSIIGIGFLTFLAVYMFQYSMLAWIVTLVWISCGFLVYTFYSRQREVEHVRKVRALERIERKEYSILVCLSNPETVYSLTSIAVAMARAHQGEILFLHVIEVGEKQPLGAGLEETYRINDLASQASTMAENAGVPHRFIIKISHRISRGIIQTATEENCNFILLSRQKKPTVLDRVFSSMMDTILRRAPSEVAVMHGLIPRDGIRRILLPYAASVHTLLAAEVAPVLTQYFNAALHVAIVQDPDMPPREREMLINEARANVRRYFPEAKFTVITERDVLAGIRDASAGADLVLMGGRSGEFLQLLLAKSLTQEITEQVHCPVLWLKEYEEIEPFWQTLFKSHHAEEKADGG